MSFTQGRAQTFTELIFKVFHKNDLFIPNHRHSIDLFHFPKHSSILYIQTRWLFILGFKNKFILFDEEKVKKVSENS